jgi:hypothetical protein
MALVYESVTSQTETAAVSSTVVASVPGGTDQMYIVGITIYTDGGSPGTSEVSSLSGGGLTWARVSGTVACSGRISQPRGELWWAFGSPSSFSLTVNYANAVRAGAGSQVTVSRISGAENTAPINGDYGNVNATSGGPSCSGGSDSDQCSIVMTVSNSDSMVLTMEQPRNGSNSSVDADYTEQFFNAHTSGGDASTQGIYTRIGGGGPTDTVLNVLSSAKPWFMCGCEIQILAVVNDLDAAMDIVLSVAAALTASGQLDASLDTVLTLAADLDAAGQLDASLDLVLSMLADLSATGELQASLPIVLTMNADLTPFRFQAGSPPADPTRMLTPKEMETRRLQREDDEGAAVAITHVEMLSK